jgi:hypothetical protein
VIIQSAAVLEAVKARPGKVGVCLYGGATADLDSFCARRRAKSTVGAEESLRRGRTKESAKARKKEKRKKALAFVAAIRERKNARGAGRTKELTQEASGQNGGCLPNMSSCQGSRVGVMDW